MKPEDPKPSKDWFTLHCMAFETKEKLGLVLHILKCTERGKNLNSLGFKGTKAELRFCYRILAAQDPPVPAVDDFSGKELLGAIAAYTIAGDAKAKEVVCRYCEVNNIEIWLPNGVEWGVGDGHIVSPLHKDLASRGKSSVVSVSGVFGSSRPGERAVGPPRRSYGFGGGLFLGRHLRLCSGRSLGRASWCQGKAVVRGI